MTIDNLATAIVGVDLSMVLTIALGVLLGMVCFTALLFGVRVVVGGITGIAFALFPQLDQTRVYGSKMSAGSVPAKSCSSKA